MKRDFLLVLKYFFIWRVALILVAAAALYLLPTFAARFPYSDRVLTITGLPNWIWGFGNFDGVHYLRIAQNGYTSEFTNAFFPLFPILTRVFSVFFPKIPGLDLSMFTDPSYFYSGLILPNLFFIGALFMFYKLLRIDYVDEISKKTLILLLVFPTAYYFGAIYTESLFLLLGVSAIYLIRKHKFLPASIFIALATATRITGVFLIIVYLIEAYNYYKVTGLPQKKKLEILLGIAVSPLGVLSYSLYLYSHFGDALYFLTVQPKFGADRSASLVLLPQVFYRYLKIFLNVPLISSSFFNAFLELIFTIFPLALLIIYLRKMRLSYWLFTLAVLLLPTLTGTLSSMPRYALLSFLLFPLIVQKWNMNYKLIILVLILLQVVLLSLFIRGYWVA